jgi:cytochrome c556
MMGHSLLKSAKILCCIGVLLAASFMPTTPALAETAQKEGRLTLRAIMQELGAAYLRLTDALLRGEFAAVEESAKAIQGHPLPDEVVTAIKAKLGKSFGRFERADQQSHQAAADLSRRAVARDLSGSAKAFGRVMECCLSCHKQFRATLRPLSD